jgi:hypothetical protein
MTMIIQDQRSNRLNFAGKEASIRKRRRALTRRRWSFPKRTGLFLGRTGIATALGGTGILGSARICALGGARIATTLGSAGVAGALGGAGTAATLGSAGTVVSSNLHTSPHAGLGGGCRKGRGSGGKSGNTEDGNGFLHIHNISPLFERLEQDAGNDWLQRLPVMARHSPPSPL